MAVKQVPLYIYVFNILYIKVALRYSGVMDVGADKGNVYKKALFQFVTCNLFKQCLQDLLRVTEVYFTHRLKGYNIQFEHCTTGFVYFELLEESLGFNKNKLSNSVEMIIKCLCEIVEMDRSLDALKGGLNVFQQKLFSNGLLKNIIILTKIHVREGQMDCSYPSPKFYPGSPIVSKILSPHLILDSEECYPINTTGKRGVCVIVNQYRPYSCRDIFPIKLLFENLNYEVIDFDNVKVNEFLDSVTDLSSSSSVYRRISDLKSDSFILILSSHGDEENVYFIDEKIPRESLIKYFLNDYCPYLIGKPKLFFFQNCRGKEGMMDNLNDIEWLMTDAKINPLKTRKLPPVSNRQSDMAQFYSSTQGTESFRDPNGTIFLQCLIEVLKDPKKKRRSLNDLQPELCRKVSEKAQILLRENDKIGCQTPQFETTLFKHYYFCHPHL